MCVCSDRARGFIHTSKKETYDMALSSPTNFSSKSASLYCIDESVLVAKVE